MAWPKRPERTAHLKPYCRVCDNTGLVKGPDVVHNGKTYPTSKQCEDCPKAYPTSVDAKVTDLPEVDKKPIDGQSRAAGEKE